MLVIDSFGPYLSLSLIVWLFVIRLFVLVLDHVPRSGLQVWGTHIVAALGSQIDRTLRSPIRAYPRLFAVIRA